MGKASLFAGSDRGPCRAQAPASCPAGWTGARGGPGLCKSDGVVAAGFLRRAGGFRPARDPGRRGAPAAGVACSGSGLVQAQLLSQKAGRILALRPIITSEKTTLLSRGFQPTCLQSISRLMAFPKIETASTPNP